MHGGGAGGEVEGQSGVGRQKAAQLEAAGEALPGGAGGGGGRVQCAIEDQAVALVVVGAAVVAPDVERAGFWV